MITKHATTFSLCGTRLMFAFDDGSPAVELNIAVLPLPKRHPKRLTRAQRKTLNAARSGWRTWDGHYGWAWDLYCKRVLLTMNGGQIVAVAVVGGAS